MMISRLFCAPALGVAFLLAASASASASLIPYSYAGNSFNGTAGTTPLTTSDFIAATLTFDNLLAANSTFD
jgi:hypothetical protein